MQVSNSERCSEHWTRMTEAENIIYELLDSETSKPDAVKQISVGNFFSSHYIKFNGEKTAFLFNEIKAGLDPKYFEACSEIVIKVPGALWISCDRMHRLFPGELNLLISTVYEIFHRHIPHFSEVSEKIKDRIEELGAVCGDSYFGREIPRQDVEWSVKNDGFGRTTYEIIYPKSMKKHQKISKVTVDDFLKNFGIQGKNMSDLCQRIENEIDPKYIDKSLQLGDVSLNSFAITVWCDRINSNYPGELKGILEKIFSIIQQEISFFTKISEEISNKIGTIGNKQKISYIAPDLPVSESLEEETLDSEIVFEELPAIVEVISEGENKKVYEINRQVWTQETIGSSYGSSLNNYSSSAQGISDSCCSYRTNYRGDGTISYFAIEKHTIYYPREDNFADEIVFVVKAGSKTLHRQEHDYDIKSVLLTFAKKRLIDKAVVDVFFK